MGTIKSNEREFSGKIAEWLNEHIKRNNYPFTSVSNEAGIQGLDTTKFGDVIFWKNREKNQAFSLVELKKPAGERENLDRLKEKAQNLEIEYAFTWNFRTLTVYRLHENELKLVDSESRLILDDVEQWKRGDVQATLKKYLSEICDQLVNLQTRGKLRRFTPDKVYFVNLFRQTADKLIPEFEQFIKNAHRDDKTRKAIQEYTAKQGIAFPSENEYYKTTARQRVYGFLTKIIFYLTVRRTFEELPDLLNIEDDNLSRAIRIAFERAREKDWQAVFVSGPLEDLGIPESSYKIVKELLHELKVYQFQNLPEDVIGELFEEIIDPRQRHNLGQYFTRVDLVDFVIGAIVNDKEGIYSDPTCGSGTFLIRLYDRINYLSGQKSHEKLLDQIWGFDIGKFPAELSTINLFRQNVNKIENFPRVRHANIFDIKKGTTFDFPPPNAGPHFKKVHIDLPAFDGFVGNFPFIRQELIEKKSKGFKKELTKLLAEEYFFTYPKLFEAEKITGAERDHLQTLPRASQLETLYGWIDKNKISLRLSGKSDIYAYIYIHLTTLLARQGSFAIITSNSWLDVSYGSILKQFFLDHFKIKMIAASWVEPWFEDAAVNTIVTVLEKQTDPQKRNENLTKFVKFNKKFKKLIPYKDLLLESSKRWQKVDALHRHIEGAEVEKEVHSITKQIKQHNSDRFDIRMLPQKELVQELQTEGKYSKWGKHLRAPDVYYEILEKCSDKLVPLNNLADVQFGIKTGKNAFFYLEVLEDKGDLIKCRNSKGWEGEIEKEFLKSVLKSPKQSKKIKVIESDLDRKIFVCNHDKLTLKAEGFTKALKYIEWGETQQDSNHIYWPDIPSVRNRENWYSLGVENFADFLWPKAFNDRFIVFKNGEFLAADRLYEIYFFDDAYLNEAAYTLNSTLQYLFIEVNGRINLGDGALDNMTYEASKCFTLDPSFLHTKDLSNKFPSRNGGSIFKEVRKNDRIEIDKEILTCLDLNPDEYLPRIYAGLCQMVKERLELPKMRKKQQKNAPRKAFDQIKASVEKDCLPHGIKQFPEAFFDPTSKKNDGISSFSELEFESYSTTGRPLIFKEFFGEYEVEDIDGVSIFQADSNSKAEYAQILNRPNRYELKIPRQNDYAGNMVNGYRTYVTDLLKKLEANAQTKLHDWSAAERMAKEILEDYGLKELG